MSWRVTATAEQGTFQTQPFYITYSLHGPDCTGEANVGVTSSINGNSVVPDQDR